MSPDTNNLVALTPADHERIQRDAANLMALALPAADPTSLVTPEQQQAIADASLVRFAAKHFRDEMDLHRASGALEAARSCFRLSNRLHELANRMEANAGIPLDEYDADGQ